jgi:hypothetical protein
MLWLKQLEPKTRKSLMVNTNEPSSCNGCGLISGYREEDQFGGIRTRKCEGCINCHPRGELCKLESKFRAQFGGVILLVQKTGSVWCDDWHAWDANPTTGNIEERAQTFNRLGYCAVIYSISMSQIISMNALAAEYFKEPDDSGRVITCTHVDVTTKLVAKNATTLLQHVTCDACGQEWEEGYEHTSTTKIRR